MQRILLITFFSFFISLSSIIAQQALPDIGKDIKPQPPIQRFFVGTALDGAIFSSATIKELQAGNTTTTNKMGTIRFSDIINFGFTFNYNIGRHIGIYTGIDIKNLGFIEKNENAEIVKRRTYNLGVPLGIKIGNMATAKPCFFLGGGVDAPFNYREKTFIIRNQKTKFSEWFSDRTPAIMPYVFVGAGFNKGFTIKAQYYPGNFLNPDFTVNGTKPYASYDVHIMMLSLGFPLQLSNHRVFPKKPEDVKVNIM